MKKVFYKIFNWTEISKKDWTVIVKVVVLIRTISPQEVFYKTLFMLFFLKKKKKGW